MATAIGSLRVDLGLNSAEFSKGLKTSQTQMAAFSKSLKGFATGLNGMLGGIGVGLGTAALVSGIRDAVNVFGDLADSAKSAGIGTDLMQSLTYQAKLGGVEFAALSAALDSFNKNSGLAVVNKGKMLGALKALNPELLANIQNARTQEERIRLAADAINGAATASERAALATTLFGESGAKLADVFAGGAAQIDSMMTKARDMGIIVDRELVARAEELGDEFDTAAGIVDLQLKQAFISLAPELVTVAKWAAEFARLMGVAADQLKAIDDRQYLRPLQNQLAETYNQMQPVKDRIAEIEAALAGGAPNGMILKLDLSEAHAKLSALEEQALRLLTRVTELQGAPSAGAAAPVSAPALAPNPNMMGGADLGILDLPSSVSNLNTQLAEVGGVASHAGSAMRGLSTSLADTVEPAAEVGETLTQSLEGVGNTLADVIKGTADFQDVLSSLLTSMLQSIDFSGLGQGGGLLQGLLGGLASFDGGGFTANIPRSGGLDGKGGFLAMMHGNEAVLDLSKGNMRSGGGQTIVMNQTISLAGAISQQGVAAIAQSYASASVEAVKQQFPGWQMNMQTHGAP